MVIDLNQVCRICLKQGTRSIFKSSNTSHELINNALMGNTRNPGGSGGDQPISLDRLAEKLRFITLLKIKENENLPYLICELCIVQANLAYNFKRLALENDFRLRQYLIENGISVQKEDECTTTNTTTSLEIRQIDVIVDSRTLQFREPVAPTSEPQPPPRRSSVISSVSGATFFGQCSNNRDSTPTSMIQDTAATRFVIPHRPIVRPIQIKMEPEELPTVAINSSPSTSTSSGITLTSSSNRNLVGPASSKIRPPMVIINHSNFQNLSSKHLTGSKQPFVGVASTSGHQKAQSLPTQPVPAKVVAHSTPKPADKISKVPAPHAIIQTRKNSKSVEDKIKYPSKLIAMKSPEKMTRLRPIKRKNLNEKELTKSEIKKVGTPKKSKITAKQVRAAMNNTNSSIESSPEKVTKVDGRRKVESVEKVVKVDGRKKKPLIDLMKSLKGVTVSEKKKIVVPKELRAKKGTTMVDAKNGKKRKATEKLDGRTTRWLNKRPKKRNRPLSERKN